VSKGASGESKGSASTFLVERYWPGVSSAGLEAAVARGRRSAVEMRRAGTRIRYLRSTLVPAEETVYCLFEAIGATDVRELNERAAIPFDRIVEAVSLVPEAPTDEDGLR
jgi:Protein of unknown function (DUF4242)